MNKKSKIGDVCNDSIIMKFSNYFELLLEMYQNL